MAVMGVWAVILCKRHRWHIKQKNKEPWKHTKQIFPEQRTKKSFSLHHLCPVHEVLTGIWNICTNCQFIWSGKVYIWLPVWEFKNYASGNHVSTSSCLLGIEILMTFNVTCLWTFHTNSILHEYLFRMHVHKYYKHFHKWIGIFYGDDSVLMRVPHIQ